MALKTIIAAGIAAVTMSLFSGSAAQAGTKVVIGIGAPAGHYHSCWGWPRRCGWRPRPVYRYVAPRPVVVYRPGVVVRRNISCAAARNIVDGSGFNSVRTRDCSGTVYSFTARRNGKLFRVNVNARNGVIVGTQRL